FALTGPLAQVDSSRSYVADDPAPESVIEIEYEDFLALADDSSEKTDQAVGIINQAFRSAGHLELVIKAWIEPAFGPGLGSQPAQVVHEHVARRPLRQHVVQPLEIMLARSRMPQCEVSEHAARRNFKVVLNDDGFPPGIDRLPELNPAGSLFVGD